MHLAVDVLHYSAAFALDAFSVVLAHFYVCCCVSSAVLLRLSRGSITFARCRDHDGDGDGESGHREDGCDDGGELHIGCGGRCLGWLMV